MIMGNRKTWGQSYELLQMSKSKISQALEFMERNRQGEDVDVAECILSLIDDAVRGLYEAGSFQEEDVA